MQHNTSEQVDAQLYEGNNIQTPLPITHDTDHAVHNADRRSDIFEINNLGWRSTDGFLYAVERGKRNNRGLVRIGSDWKVEHLGYPDSLAGEPWPREQRFDAGDISTDGTTMYIHNGTSDGMPKLYVVDLTPIDSGGAPVLTDVVEFTFPDNQERIYDVHDWAYHPGFDPDEAMLFGGANGRDTIAVLKLTRDAAGVLTANYSVSEVAAFAGNRLLGGVFGGAHFNSDRQLVLYRNKGNVYVIDIDVNNLAAAKIVGFEATEEFNRIDTTSCRQPVLCEEAYIVQHAGAKLYKTATGGSSPFSETFELCNAFELSDFTQEPLSEEVEFNNMCARARDELYAFELFKGPNGAADGGNRGLVRINPDSCQVERLGVPLLPDGQPMPTQLPFGEARFDAGDCRNEEGVMFVNLAGKLGEPFYRVDLASLKAVAAPVEKKTPNSNIVGFVHDWAYNSADGKLYGGDNTQGHLATIEFVMEDGQWKAKRHDRRLKDGQLLPTGDTPLDAYGGAWFEAGNLLVLHRNDGLLFEIDVTTREILGTRQLVDGLTLNDQIAEHNDGDCFP